MELFDTKLYDTDSRFWEIPLGLSPFKSKSIILLDSNLLKDKAVELK